MVCDDNDKAYQHGKQIIKHWKQVAATIRNVFADNALRNKPQTDEVNRKSRVFHSEELIKKSLNQKYLKFLAATKEYCDANQIDYKNGIDAVVIGNLPPKLQEEHTKTIELVQRSLLYHCFMLCITIVCCAQANLFNFVL